VLLDHPAGVLQHGSGLVARSGEAHERRLTQLDANRMPGSWLPNGHDPGAPAICRQAQPECRQRRIPEFEATFLGRLHAGDG
jgi:hypothetical protein